MLASLTSQFRRVWSADMGDEKDFSEQEARLRQAQQSVTEASEALRKVAELLKDALIKRRPPAESQH